MYIQKGVLCLFICCIVALAQYQYYPVTSVNSSDATAFSNSHKLATRYGELPSDTIHFVYHDNDSIYYIRSLNMGVSWETPYALCPGLYPAFDIYHNEIRHVAYQQFDPGDSTYDVYYDCLDDWAAPVNISESSNNSTHPDVVADEHLMAHIVWVEEIGQQSYIYYRPCTGAMPGDTMRISDFGSTEATYSFPSISLFGPSNRIYVCWDCLDTACYSPYQIHVRYKQGATWSSVTSYAHYLPQRHSSIDFGHAGVETLSFCYEDSTSGNLEATFVGGNGGGYTTQGNSTYPVLSTVDDVWSYLYWQEDSSGYVDICYHLYYLMTGWTRGTIRTVFSIDEPVRYPNCCGAYVVWTQGDSTPYTIYIADFGYPIGIAESQEPACALSINAKPNPFTHKTQIRVATDTKLNTPVSVYIYDVTGQLIKHCTYPTIQQSNYVIWDGTDETGKEVPAGIYYCVCGNSRGATKVTKLR
jgi:hypothetical protein